VQKTIAETIIVIVRREVEMSIAEIILKFLLKAFEAAKEAYDKKDPSKLRKVTDVFKDGDPFEVELTLAEERAKALAEHKP